MGWSREKTDFLGRKYVQHYNNFGIPCGSSREKTDFWGRKYVQHYGSAWWRRR